MENYDHAARRAAREAHALAQREKACNAIEAGLAYIARLYGDEVAAEIAYNHADHYAALVPPRLPIFPGTLG